MMAQVAFQGEHGAYSEQAVLIRQGHGARTQPCRTLREVFGSVMQGRADLGVIPAENSIEGSVNETYDLLLEFPLRICGEIKLRIEHCLLALPETAFEQLRVVYSHPQALAQCARYLSTLNVETEPTYDTAGSAKMIRERSLGDAGAIASGYAGNLYGLKVLQRNIEDFADNFTRFFVIGQREMSRTGVDKTTIAFGTRHEAGSLHKALGELAKRGINLTRIESRPLRTTPWEYSFFLDFEGHASDPLCAEALSGLKQNTTFLRVFGSYPRSG